jgi:hypothetical protein
VACNIRIAGNDLDDGWVMDFPRNGLRPGYAAIGGLIWILHNAGKGYEQRNRSPNSRFGVSLSMTDVLSNHRLFTGHEVPWEIFNVWLKTIGQPRQI